MTEFHGRFLVMTHDEYQQFLNRLEHPDPDAIRRRNALFKRLDEMNVTENADGSRSFEFPPVKNGD